MHYSFRKLFFSVGRAVKETMKWVLIVYINGLKRILKKLEFHLEKPVGFPTGR